jgi:hypothetical protein
MALATVYLFWSVLAERLLTSRQALVAVLISAAFGAAWVTMLRAAGVELAWTRTTDVFWTLSPMVLLLMSCLLGPWSLSRIRHA